ncbi:hypothetical protein BVY01_04480 [bacterium I07]|nr:hypothetical protein BVY01_04480 [bacterium I07]
MINKVISHFKILEKLGEGGMGVVYKAHDTKLDRIVALKFLPSHITANETDKARFLQEAKAAAALNHTNVCTIHEIREHEDQQFIVMEYVEGVTLSQKIKSSPLELKTVIDYAMQIGEGLKAAHAKGIVHRDIKSSNIMVTETNQIKVMDFGLAKLRGSTKLTKTTSTVGTLAYMSPEHLQNKDIDARTDIFSFGVVLYEMLTSELPFKGDYDSALMYAIVNDDPEPVSKFRSEVSSEFIHIMNRVLEKDPEDRYQSVKEMVIDLRRVKRDSDRVVKKTIRSAREVETDSRNLHKGKSSKKLRQWIVPVGIISAVIVISAMILPLIFNSAKSFPWFYSETEILPLATDQGKESGRVSPTGDYVVYMDAEKNIILKDLKLGAVKKISPNESGSFEEPSWHPDGNRILFTGFGTRQNPNGTTIYVYNLGLSKITNIFSKDKLIYTPVFSPDGKSIAFRYRISDDEDQLITMDLDGRNETIYSVNGRTGRICWSPDSKKIAFINRSLGSFGVLQIIDLLTEKIYNPMGIENRVSPNAFTSDLAWSPDGEYMIYTGQDSTYSEDLFSIRIDPNSFKIKGEPLRITDFKGFQSPGKLTFTKDGQSFSFILFNSTLNICSIPISLEIKSFAGNVIPIVTSNSNEYWPSWTKDGKSVVFASNRSGTFQIYMKSIGASNPIQLTSTPGSKSVPKILPDGQNVSFFDSEYRTLCQISLEGGIPVPIVPDTVPIYGMPYNWFQDSKRIGTMLNDSTKKYPIVVFDTETKMMQNLFTTGDTAVFTGTISPDDKQLAVEWELEPSSRTISIYNFEKRSFRHIYKYEAVQGGYLPLLWSPDGLYLLKTRMTPDEKYVHELISVKNGQTSQLEYSSVDITDHIYMFEMSPDGKQVLLVVQSVESDIYLMKPKSISND